jgi:hypothetical protein
MNFFSDSKFTEDENSPDTNEPPIELEAEQPVTDTQLAFLFGVTLLGWVFLGALIYGAVKLFGAIF